MGKLRLRELAKYVIQGELGDSEGAKLVGFSHGHFDLVIQTLDNATGELLFGPEIVEDQLTVAAQRLACDTTAETPSLLGKIRFKVLQTRQIGA